MSWLTINHVGADPDAKNIGIFYNEVDMLKTCVTCGRIHTPACQPKRDDTKANAFRQTKRWEHKSIEIRERDHYLCQCCIRNLYDTERLLNCEQIEVHHIVPLCEGYDRRLDDDNLISLCKRHHKMAETGKIGKSELREWVDMPPAIEKV